MSEKTPVEVVREYLEIEQLDFDHELERRAACEAFKEITDLNEWYEKRCKWYNDELTEARAERDKMKKAYSSMVGHSI